MNHHEWIELADIYAVGALEAGELSDFKKHLDTGCELCRTRILENQNAMVGLLQGMPQKEVPAAVKARIFETLEAQAPPVAVLPGAHAFWAPLGAWALVCAVILGGWQMTGAKRHGVEFSRLESAMKASGQTKMVELKTLNQTAPAFGKMIWNEKGDCLFMTMGLTRPQSDKIYQLWGIAGDQKISAGIFTVDDHGCAVLTMNQFAGNRFEKFAVTLEPQGGVLAPTGPMVLLGSI